MTPPAAVMSALFGCLHNAQKLQPALWNVYQHVGVFSSSAWLSSSSSHMRSSCTKQYSSSSSDTPPHTATPSSSSSDSSSSIRDSSQQQQPQHAASAFSTSPDAFTAHLQSKTEADVFQMLEKARATKLAEAAAAAKAASKAAAGTVDGGGDATAAFAAADAELDAEEDDTVDVVNPETGEAYGPRGKEPTRYGDWEIKGRCTDFS